MLGKLMSTNFMGRVVKAGTMASQHGASRFSEMTSSFNKVGSTLKGDWAALSKSMKAQTFMGKKDAYSKGYAGTKDVMSPGSAWKGLKSGFKSFDKNHMQLQKNTSKAGEMHSRYADYANVGMAGGAGLGIAGAGASWAFGGNKKDNARKEFMDARVKYMESRR